MQTAKIRAFVFGLALVTTACGDSMSSLNPTAPSSLKPGSLSVEADEANGVAGSMGNGPKPGNTGNGNGNGNNGNGNGNGGGQTPSSSSGPVETRVQLEGTIDAVGNDSITVNGQVVKVNAQTVIRHGDLRYGFSALSAGDRVHVNAMRSESNGVVTMVATEVKLQNEGEGGETEPPPPPPPAGSLSVVAVDAAAQEGSDNATFRITRSGDASLLALPLTLSFNFGGNATRGVDYNAPTSVEFAGGALTADVLVTALADNLAEVSEAVTLTLSAVAPYTVGSNASATVNIADPPAPAVSVAASTSTVSQNHPDGFTFGAFVFTRSGDRSAAITLSFTVGGSAGGAYAADLLATPVTFAAGQESASVAFLTFPGHATGTVVVTVNAGPGYAPGTPASATVTVTP